MMKRVIALLLTVSLTAPVNAGWWFWKKEPLPLPRETHWGERAGFIIIIVPLIASSVYFLIDKGNIELKLNQKRGKLTAKDGRIRELEGEVAQKAETISAVSSQINYLNGTVTELTSRLEDKTEENERLHGQLRCKEHDFSMQVEKAERQRAEISKLRQDIGKLMLSARYNDAEITSVKKIVNTQIERLRVAYGSTIKRCCFLHNKKRDGLTRGYAAVMNDLRSQIRSKEEKLK
jgi:chromosome segregation ATPase